MLLVALSNLTASIAAADLPAYLELTVNGQVIAGDSLAVETEDQIAVYAVSLPVFSTVSSGGAVRNPSSRPVTLLMDFDRSGSEILNAWATGATVNSAVISLYRATAGGGGATENWATLTLSGGRISSYVLNSPDSLDPAVQGRPATLLVGLTYQSATLAENASGQSRTITWQTGGP
ncbi:MAG: type VI secretion system tube protein Hcp [Myxococcota bacterium]